MATKDNEEQELNNQQMHAEQQQGGEGNIAEAKESTSEEEEDAVVEVQLSAEEQLQIDVTEAKDKYLRLYSEFENFRRRNAKERLELVKTASADVITELLPVVDDFERATKSFEENEASKEIMEGIQLIHSKFLKVLEGKGLTAMDNKPGIEFDPEIHEAITKIPAPSKKLRGKVVDTVEKGYTLGDKVIRYAKVVIGE
jgi:molecular chaperone GrpE